MFDHVWQQIEVNGGADTSSCDGHVGGEHGHLLRRLLSLGCVLTPTPVCVAVKPDASFWHHGSQLQLTHYGQDFATASMYFSAITSKTKGYRMPQSSYDAFSMLVLVRAATVGLGLRLLPALTADRCC